MTLHEHDHWCNVVKIFSRNRCHLFRVAKPDTCL